MQEGFLAVAPDGRILTMNRVFSSLFGLSSDKATDTCYRETVRHPPLQDLIASVQSQGKPHRGDIRLFTPEERIFAAQATPLQLEGTGVGVVLVLYDITQLRHLERVRKDFVANVSHELRTPLASIKGFAETLRIGGLEDRKNRGEFVEAIERHANRLSALVEDLLELSTLESEQSRLRKSHFPLTTLVTELRESLAPIAEQAHVQIHVQIPDDLHPLHADRHSIKQVFINLLDNAIKFNHPDGSIRIEAVPSPGTITVTVRDTGIGIPPEELPRIYERFYRVDKGRSRDRGGTGLGLAIAKHIIEAHGGTLTANSDGKSGTSFSFTLPIH